MALTPERIELFAERVIDTAFIVVLAGLAVYAACGWVLR